MADTFLKHNGDFRSLKVYKLSVIISVITEVFVERFIHSKSRTKDQMQQAARSCKQNIVEGSSAAMTSKETEIKLTNVARASLEELEEDYLDQLRFKGLPIWDAGHPRLTKLREFVRSREFEITYLDLVKRLPEEEFCNLAITLINQTKYLLDRLLKSQQERFLKEGGIRETMNRARREYRERYQGYPPSWNKSSSQEKRNLKN
ncbi:MAG: four helix bundle suffix domain-containing protein [Muribaculaceae bacterium]|nr:four helix bundle suffix domain-containing protein [Muribaculaceae bacterium]